MWLVNIYELTRGAHYSPKLQMAFNNCPTLDWEFYPSATNELAAKMEWDYITANAGNPNMANQRGNGYTLTPENAEKLRASNLGRTHTAETIKLRVDKLRGRPCPPERGINISRAHKNSDGVKANMIRLHEEAKRQVEVDGVVYESVKPTAATFGISSATVLQRIKSSSDKFSNWQYGR